MEQLIPRTLRRWESYQSSLARQAVLAQLGRMTRGCLRITLPDGSSMSFGYGSKLAAEMAILDERFFSRFWNRGALGFGESFVQGEWTSPDLVLVIRWFLLNSDTLDASVRAEGLVEGTSSSFLQLMDSLRGLRHSLGLEEQAPEQKPWALRYDLERPFFTLMLDAGLNNSGALFQRGDSLEEAQTRKHQALAELLRIRPGDRVLELGSGWGSFAIFLAQNYDCHVTAVTLAEEQNAFLEKRVSQLDLEKKINARHADFRTIDGLYDRIVSIELIDALDASEQSAFFALCENWLKPQGFMVHQLLLTPQCEPSDDPSDWTERYISPGIRPPTLPQLIHRLCEGPRFALRSFQDIGLPYSQTLAAWSRNFRSHLPQLRQLGFEERFIRSWHYYLSYSEAAFAHGLLSACILSAGRATERGDEATA